MGIVAKASVCKVINLRNIYVSIQFVQEKSVCVDGDSERKKARWGTWFRRSQAGPFIFVYCDPSFNRASCFIRGNQKIGILSEFRQNLSFPRSPSPISEDDSNCLITNEGSRHTCSVVHPEYTTRKLVSKPLPNPNLDDRPPLYLHYLENRETGVLV